MHISLSRRGASQVHYKQYSASCPVREPTTFRKLRPSPVCSQVTVNQQPLCRAQGPAHITITHQDPIPLVMEVIGIQEVVMS